jgi:AbrB family looped-hinge helix DNA binding protein
MANAAGAKSRVSTKGQIVLPKAIRDRRKWAPGTELTVEETPDGVLLKTAPLFAPTKIEDVAGMLRDKSRESLVVSIEEMDEAVLAEARRRCLRSFDDRD